MLFTLKPFRRKLPRNRGYRLKKLAEREQKLQEIAEECRKKEEDSGSQDSNGDKNADSDEDDS